MSKILDPDNRVVRIIRLSKQAFWSYKRSIITLIMLGFMGGILEGVGVNALIPLFSFILEGSQSATDPISRFIETTFTFLHIPYSVKYILLLIGALFVGKAIVTLILNYIRIKITANYEEQTKSSLFKKILRSNWPFLIRQKLGYLETVLTIDVPTNARLLDQVSSAIIVGTSLLVYIVVAVNISFVITLVVLALGGVLFLVFKPLNYRIKKLAYERTRLNRDTAHHINENVLGLKTVKSMDVEKNVQEKGSGLFRAYRDVWVRTNFWKSVSGSIVQPIGVVVVCFIFAATYRNPAFSLPALAAIVYLVERIFIYIQQLQKNLHNINDSIPHVLSTLDYSRDAEQHKEIERGSDRFVFKNKLEFKDVAFAYNSNNPVFSKVSFDIPRGTQLGLIGPSGVGKTTIVDLILRLLIPTSGSILLDGKNIEDINLHEWRSKIGYVSQDIFLINGTIAENIRFYEEGITEEQIIEAAKQANIYDFIKKAPEGLNTIIGERGLMVSAGQRQRIVIARILARRPEFLILDEATSALDNESEQQIQNVIHNLHGKITVLAIAHRLSTIEDSDRLVVLREGGIAEVGTPQELMKDKKSYFNKVYSLRNTPDWELQ